MKNHASIIHHGILLIADVSIVALFIRLIIQSFQDGSGSLEYMIEFALYGIIIWVVFLLNYYWLKWKKKIHCSNNLLLRLSFRVLVAVSILYLLLWIVGLG